MLDRLLPTKKPILNPASCPVCGGGTYEQRPVLWDGLAQAWQLSPEEVRYIDQQQGHICLNCQSNLRSRTLAGALLDQLGFEGTLAALCHGRRCKKLRLLELNEAGGLSGWLQKLPGHTLATYPEVDMQSLPYADGSWEMVLHSDVLEHVPDPALALQECHRVLVQGGILIYTVPIVHGRLTRSRASLPPSYHGDASTSRSDWLVHTEFGADFWLMPMAAGFRKITLFSLTGPQSLAIVCRK